MEKKSAKFDPVDFIGEGWSIESDNGFNPDSLDGIELRHFLKDDESYITGEQIVERIGNNKPLNADAFLQLWKNQHLIPKSWYKVEGWIEFTGTVLRGSGGRRYFLCLRRRGDGSWGWSGRWLVNDSIRGYVSPLLASDAETLDSSCFDPLPLELVINGIRYKKDNRRV